MPARRSLRVMGNGTWLKSATPRMRGDRDGAVLRRRAGPCGAQPRACAAAPRARTPTGSHSPAVPPSRTAISCPIGRSRSTLRARAAATCWRSAAATRRARWSRCCRSSPPGAPSSCRCRCWSRPIPMAISATPLIDGRAPLEAARAMLAAARASGARAIVLRHVTLEGAAMQSHYRSACRARPRAARAARRAARLPRCHARCRHAAARCARRKEAEGAATAAQPPRRARPGHGFGRDHARGRGPRDRNLSGAGSERLEGRSRHRADPARRRRGLHPPRQRRAWRRAASAR